MQTLNSGLKTAQSAVRAPDRPVPAPGLPGPTPGTPRPAPRFLTAAPGHPARSPERPAPAPDPPYRAPDRPVCAPVQPGRAHGGQGPKPRNPAKIPGIRPNSRRPRRRSQERQPENSGQKTVQNGPASIAGGVIHETDCISSHDRDEGRAWLVMHYTGWHVLLPQPFPLAAPPNGVGTSPDSADSCRKTACTGKLRIGLAIGSRRQIIGPGLICPRVRR